MSRRYVLLNVSGPYGVGKDTIINTILREHAARVHRVSTVTTRPTSTSADPSYRSVSKQELEDITSNGDWLITRQLGGEVLYATSLEEIDLMTKRGLFSVHSIYPSDEGAGGLRKAFGSRLFSLGVLASVGDLQSQIAVLRSRLLARGRDEPDVVDARLGYQSDAIDYILRNPGVETPDGIMPVFDEVLVNDDIASTEEFVRRLWAEQIEPTLDEMF